jgi:outer membrane lipoprotein SlyB
MRVRKILLSVALSVAMPTLASAQEGTVSGAAGGAVTGAVVGGPVGAVVGGVAGAVIGTALAPPKQVRTYVVQDRSRPSVTYSGNVVVGERLPETVEVYSVPDSDYSYTVVNDRRYIVSSDRKVVEVVE